MPTTTVSWTRDQAIMDPSIGVAVQACFYGEIEVEGAWPAAQEWLENGFAAIAIEVFQALRIPPAEAAANLDGWIAKLLARANEALAPHGMKALSVPRLEISVSRESTTALRDIQAAIAKAKDETQKRQTRA